MATAPMVKQISDTLDIPARSARRICRLTADELSAIAEWAGDSAAIIKLIEGSPIEDIPSGVRSACIANRLTPTELAALVALKRGGSPKLMAGPEMHSGVYRLSMSQDAYGKLVEFSERRALSVPQAIRCIIEENL